MNEFCSARHTEANEVRRRHSTASTGSAGDALATAVETCADEDVLELLEVASRAKRAWEHLAAVTSGVIAARSQRDAGQRGLAQARRHRNAVALVQQVAQHDALRRGLGEPPVPPPELVSEAMVLAEGVAAREA